MGTYRHLIRGPPMTAKLPPGGERFCMRHAVVSFTVGVLLVLPAMRSRAGKSQPVALQAPGPAATDTSQGCQWSPYLLPLDALTYAQEEARLEVPSIVLPIRRYLTVQLAQLVLLNNVPGDFVETGTFRGGTTILMLRALEKYDPQLTRVHWAADSFQGLPELVEQDMKRVAPGSIKGKKGAFSTGREQFMFNVRQFNFSRLDARMRVLEGWFNETLPQAPIQKIAYLRLDGDLYSSTRDALDALYDKVSPGGAIYVDDYGSFNGCRRAVDEFRAERNITAPLMLQALPDLLFRRPPSKTNKWESAFWFKPC